MSNAAQPSVTGTDPGPTPQASPQPMSTRLSGAGATITAGCPLPFVQPPVRSGNPAQPQGTKPFRVGGG